MLCNPRSGWLSLFGRSRRPPLGTVPYISKRTIRKRAGLVALENVKKPARLIDEARTLVCEVKQHSRPRVGVVGTTDVGL